jgi:hypothetical protein
METARWSLRVPFVSIATADALKAAALLDIHGIRASMGLASEQVLRC